MGGLEPCCHPGHLVYLSTGSATRNAFERSAAGRVLHSHNACPQAQGRVADCVVEARRGVCQRCAGQAFAEGGRACLPTSDRHRMACVCCRGSSHPYGCCRVGARLERTMPTLSKTCARCISAANSAAGHRSPMSGWSLSLDSLLGKEPCKRKRALHATASGGAQGQARLVERVHHRVHRLSQDGTAQAAPVRPRSALCDTAEGIQELTCCPTQST